METLLSAAGAFVAGMIQRFVDGDDGPEVRRVIDILPGDLRSQAELERQRAELERELRASGKT